ncbi:MAG: hypothetical protein Kow0081_2500 [Candidatus Dojkabacteria bacterium]
MTKIVKLSTKSKTKKLSRRVGAQRKVRKIARSRGKFTISEQIMKKIARAGLVFVVFLLMLSLIGSVVFFNFLQKINAETPSLDKIFATPPTPSIVYDRNGKELTKIIGEVNTDPVNIDVIPEKVRWAFLAAEDVDFYSHNGFDTAGMIRCGINFIRAGGDSICGGSTITQQLIKMTALSDETSKVERKIKELFMSTSVEQQNSKKEILQMYLTVAPFGGNIVGIETAAQYYFRKEPKDLTLAEAAILASIVQNPAYLSPTNPVDGDIESAQLLVKNRQLYVLSQIEKYMDQINNQIIINEKQRAKEQGIEFDQTQVELFTKESIEEARNQELQYAPPVATNKLAGNFVDYVIGQLQVKNYKDGGEQPFTLADLQNGGYRIYTTLDYELQVFAEQAALKGGNDYKYLNVHNAAVMTIVPSTGEIITMAGSKNFYGESEGCDANGANCKFNPQVNVLATPQSPGSTNKPLGYNMAIEQGLVYPGSMLPDIPISIGSYVPKNWDGGFRGVERTVVQNLRASLNIPALTIIEMIGIQNYAREAEEWGYSTYTKDENGTYTGIGHSVILGGTDILPVEHAAAYGVFANQGEYVAPQSILKIEDRNGNVIYEHRPERVRVSSEESTFIVNQMLYNLDHFKSWDGRDVSSKTGTTEDNRDSWIVAYSPDFVTLAWAGNNNNEPTLGWPITAITPWLQEYMRNIGNAPYFSAKTPFKRPGLITRGGGECNENGECFGLTQDWKLQGVDVPWDRKKVKAVVCTDQPNRLARPVDIALGLSEEKEFYEYKMPAPAWQGFLDNYLKSDSVKAASPVPTAQCDVPRGESVVGPIINITSPVEGAKLEDQLTITGSIASIDSTIKKVDVLLNAKNIGQINEYINFSQTFNLTSLGITDGAYNLVIRATDANGFVSNKSIQVTIGDPEALTVNFTQLPPGNMTFGQNVGNGTGAYSITVDINSTTQYSSVELYQVATYDDNSAETTFLGNMIKASGTSYTLPSWGAGIQNRNASYSFYIVVKTISGEEFTSSTSSPVRVKASI